LLQQQDKIKQLLAYFSHKIIAKYKPLIIGITGSVGKTSTRHAIAAALSAKYHLREPEKNFNNDIGIPLTIIGARGLDEGSFKIGPIQFGWIRILLKALSVWLLPQDYPKVLVLEYGIDHPGEMDILLDIATPKIAVLTTIGVSHKEHFSTNEEIAHEKGKMAARLSENGIFVYNADDAHVSEQTKRTEAHLLSYGHTDADVVLQKVEETLSLQPMTKIFIKSPVREIKVNIPAVGTAHVEAILAAIAVCEALQMETDVILKGLANYRGVPGRLNILSGIKRSVIIDDTYNAAPLSMTEALQLLGRFPINHKVAVLGDMLELGDESESAHSEIGKLVASLKINQLVTVGQLGKQIAQSALQAGMEQENIISFDNSDNAKTFVLETLQPDSVVLVKGSQGARMEKITKELLAEPMSAGQVLVRQYGHWLD
jgi:UDP-N-acetylmuramoyl-tripeptide--D-alanyl-D-alanine ligase